MDRIKREADWYDRVQIEIRAVHCLSHPERKFYQVMRLHPRECLTQFLSREQAISFCEKEKLNIVEIIDNKKDL